MLAINIPERILFPILTYPSLDQWVTWILQRMTNDRLSLLVASGTQPSLDGSRFLLSESDRVRALSGGCQPNHAFRLKGIRYPAILVFGLPPSGSIC